MKKKLIVLCVVPLLLLAACGKAEEEEPFSAAFTIRPPESLTEVYYEVPMPNETGSGTTLPSDANTLRLQDLQELMSQSMFGEKEDASVCLWTQQVRYTLEGSFTEDDRTALTNMAQTLMQIAPFPGIRETDAKSANVIVHFADVSDAQFTYTADANGAITAGQMTIPSALSSWQRSALLEKTMFRLFGFFYKTDTHLSSVLAEEPAASLTEADLIVLETVYGQLQPGMTKDDAVSAFSNAFFN